MSVKDCKDLPLELDSVKLMGKRGLAAITIENGVAGAVSQITEITQGTLAIISTATQSLDSAIAFEAQDGAGVPQVPLYMTGSVIEITGALTINGTPFVPVGGENIEDVLTVGDDAGGLDIVNLNDVGLVSINGTPYTAYVPPPATTYPIPYPAIGSNTTQTYGAQVALPVMTPVYLNNGAPIVLPAGVWLIEVDLDVFAPAGMVYNSVEIEYPVGTTLSENGITSNITPTAITSQQATIPCVLVADGVSTLNVQVDCNTSDGTTWGISANNQITYTRLA